SPSLLPVAIITALGQVGTSNDWRWRITGVDAAGSSQDLEYRAAWHYGDTPFPGWPDWSPLPPAGVTIDLARHPYRSWTLGAQVRDAKGRVSVDAWAHLPPGLPGIDPTTGKLKWSEILDDDGGKTALINEATSKGQNLLPASAWPEIAFGAVFDKWFNPGGIGDDELLIPLDDMGIGPGDTVVLSGRVRSNAGGRVALQTRFYDAADVVVGSILTADVTATAYTSVSATGTVPSNAVTCATRVINWDFTTNTVFSKQVTLNRGTVPLVEPPPG